MEPPSVARAYRYWRVRVMYAMMGGYATFYFVRQNMAIANKPIMDEFHFSNTEWGGMLASANVVYGLSKFLSGVLADIFKPKYIMALGLLVSGLVSLVFGLGHTLGYFYILWMVNSVFQGMGMTPCSRLITFWFSPRELGRAWGVWNASHQLGGAAIYLIAGYLTIHYGWRSAFWAPGAFAVLVSFWLLNRLPHSPEAQGLPPIEVFHRNTADASSAAQSLPTSEAYGGDVAVTPPEPPERFGRIFVAYILTNPWVWIVSVSNFFVYAVRSGILTWGPKYLQESKGFSLGQSAWIGSAFEVTGLFGALAAGWLSDTVFRGRRAPVSVSFMILLAATAAALFTVPHGNVPWMLTLFSLIGFFVYGPQLLVAVAAADAATKKAAATAVGLTGLFGYLGAGASNWATGVLADRWGWDAVIWFYAGAALVGAALLATTWRLKAKPSPGRRP